MKKFLSDIVSQELQIQPLLFVKNFPEKQYKNDFIEGRIYANTFEYFVNEEKRNGQGRGDAYEGINTISDTHLRFYKSGTNELLMEAEAGVDGVKSKIKGTEKMHLLSMTGIFPDWFEIKSVNKDEKIVKYNCKLVIPKEYKENMKEEFGSEIVFFSANDFMDQLDNFGQKYNEKIMHGKVKYLDFRANPKERISAFIENRPDFYFQKDLIFEGQHEYRFLFPNITSSEGEILTLDNKVNTLEEINTLKDLENSDFNLIFEFPRT